MRTSAWQKVRPQREKTDDKILIASVYKFIQGKKKLTRKRDRKTTYINDQ